MMYFHNPAHFRSTCLFATMALIFGFSALTAAEVEITFEEPRKFSDVGRDSPTFHRATFENFERTVQKKVENLAGEYLPDDASLSLTFKDVDLAGEVEPWVGRSGDQVRVVRDIYPPRLKFHYVVNGPEGEELAEGMAQLSDMNFLWGANRIRQNETFYYEMELLDDWARKTLDGLGEAEASDSGD